MPPTSCATVMATTTKRQKYEAKNLATKVEILQALKNGESQHLMTKYNMKRSTLGTYVKNEQQILQAFESEKFHASRNGCEPQLIPSSKKLCSGGLLTVATRICL
ncbi:hypothetical protein HPB49_004504 [Dermacentor silvarum]|uniref:Uncharacterized protein n=1 Tax=Dermacentor silvarum TaxID=543639 RepID=A0ACB8DUB2_DERSI|nr:hypothetical protein HPB49_004504 [Dermacentor silvarum]